MATIKLNKTDPTQHQFVGLVHCGDHVEAAFAHQTGVNGGFVYPSSDAQIFTAPLQYFREDKGLGIPGAERQAALLAFQEDVEPVLFLRTLELNGRMTKNVLIGDGKVLGVSRVDNMFFGEVPLKHTEGYKKPTWGAATDATTAPPQQHESGKSAPVRDISSVMPEAMKPALVA